MTASANSFGATGSNTECWKYSIEEKNPKILGENILEKALEQIDLTTFCTEKLFNLRKV